MDESINGKGYITINLKKDSLELCELGIFGAAEDEMTFYADYEDGRVFIDWGDGSEKQVIGYYEPAISVPYTVVVYDKIRSNMIGRVGGEWICFIKETTEQGKAFPEQKMIASYTQNGSITKLDYMSDVSIINGDITGGAAAFVALFHEFDFKCVFSDFFLMEDNAFMKKHAVYFEN